jgi:hypothetical protein
LNADVCCYILLLGFWVSNIAISGTLYVITHCMQLIEIVSEILVHVDDTKSKEDVRTEVRNAFSVHDFTYTYEDWNKDIPAQQGMRLIDRLIDHPENGHIEFLIRFFHLWCLKF